jgi:predicted dehydrogenase
MDFPEVNQQAVQMDDFAICLKNKEKSRIPGEMGLRDVQIITAIYESASIGKKVML